ncbi:hypothetical protein HPB47_004114 [Ixodes persulcatus]|uniref:Uncharacterized protein n=1 Tax=Ixodes persulcatus TaxID=34615 RepID=A0AC60PI76_IXOPE|nr:hypothetical protein HPB47_004114 [Ixodes persulcatus]
MASSSGRDVDGSKLYLDWLRIIVQGGQEDHHAKRRFEDYKRLASQTTEFIWQQTRMQLPPKKKRAAVCMDNVSVLGGATLPDEIKDVLNKGPKYSFEPSTSRPELLAMVRRVANSAGEQSRERAIGDGVDCLKESRACRRTIVSDDGDHGKFVRDMSSLELVTSGSQSKRPASNFS